MAPALDDPSTQTPVVAATAVQAGVPDDKGTPESAGPNGGEVAADDAHPDGEVRAAGGWHTHPAARAQATPATRAPASPPPDRGPSTRDPARRLLAGLLAGAVLLTAVIAGIVLLMGTDDPGDTAAQNDSSGSGRGGGGQQSEAPTTEPDQTDQEQADRGGSAPDVPDGYRLVQDPLDFTVAVPRGWQRRLDGATRVDYVSPDGSQFLRIDQIAQAGSDAEQAWLDAEGSLSESLSDYERIRIEPVDYRRWEAADWEFTWASDSGRVRVLNRGFITDPRGFAIYASGPDESWETETLPVFEVAADTFRPST